MSSEKSKVLIITGMHRSGTSVITNYLRNCGLAVARKLVEADIGNPFGYFEDQDFLEFHLNALKKNGQNTFRLNQRRLPLSMDRSDYEAARKIIESRMNLPLWGWKDCRTALMLDFWHELLPEAAFLFLVRPPRSVVDSLLRRATDPAILRRPHIGLKAWRIYNERMLQFYERNPNACLIRETNDLLSDGESLLGSLADRFDINMDPQPFHSVLVDGAFHSKPQHSLASLEFFHPWELRRCEKIYNELRSRIDNS